MATRRTYATQRQQQERSGRDPAGLFSSFFSSSSSSTSSTNNNNTGRHRQQQQQQPQQQQPQSSQQGQQQQQQQQSRENANSSSSHVPFGGTPNAFTTPREGTPLENMRSYAAAMEERHRREQEEERRQRGPPPASRAALRSIPEVTVAVHDLDEETNRSCSICLDDHELGGKAVKLPCAHIFHKNCLWEWLEMHCTCPVCRFELETENVSYERDRRVRMRGRRPRYRRRELEGLSIPQIRNVARQQNISIAGCIEKADIVARIISSGTIELIESTNPEYDAEELSQMSVRQLKLLMLQTGIEVEGCLEKADLFERVMTSRLITVTHREAPATTPSTPPAGEEATTERGGGWGGGGGGASSRWAGEGQESSSSPSSSRAESSGTWTSAAEAGTGGGGEGEGAPPPSQSSSSVPSWTPPPPPPPSSSPSSSSSPHAATAPALGSMSVKELRGIMGRLGVSVQGCLEKRDMVERIRTCERYRSGAR